MKDSFCFCKEIYYSQGQDTNNATWALILIIVFIIQISNEVEWNLNIFNMVFVEMLPIEHQ